MKKTLVMLMVILAVLFTFFGCSGAKETVPDTGDETALTQETDLDVVRDFQRPAEVARIDMTAEDPSTEEIQFRYDSQGRVTDCYYKNGENDVMLGVTYEDGYAQIYAFINDILVADDQVELSEFDANQGFAEIDGYYFKGYTAG